jgi:uncharacterized delta-60 repeat protein
MKTLRLLATLTAALLCGTGVPATAQTAGSLDPSFGHQFWRGSSPYGTPWVTVVLPARDGKVYLGGSDIDLLEGPRPRPAIARLTSDGTLDGSFASGVASWLGDNEDADVYAAALQPDGKLIIAGECLLESAPSVSVLRLNADGTRDTGFTARTLPVGDDVRMLALQEDGKILIGAEIVSMVPPFDLPRITTVGIQRLNADGSQDPGFKSVSLAESQGFESTTCVVVLPDGKLLIGGDSYPLDSVFANGRRCLRLNADGSLDTSFGPVVVDLDLRQPQGTMRRGSVLAMVRQPDGKVVIGGWFTHVNGSPKNSIARLNADGSLDQSFDGGLRETSYVTSMAQQSDGRILVAGWSIKTLGTAGASIARLEADGSLDSTFSLGTTGGYGISTIALEADGNVLVGGSFSLLNGASRRGYARLLGSDRPTAQDRYATAAQAAGLSGEAAAPESVPQGDGVANLHKYAFNLDMHRADGGSMPQGGVRGLPSVLPPRADGTFRFEFLRRRNSGLVYIPQRSTRPDIASWWSTLTGIAPKIEPIDATWERLTYEVKRNEPNFFFRVEVRLP